MSVIGEALFYRSDMASVQDVVRHKDAHMQKVVDEYDQHKFDAQTDEEVVAALERELRVEPLIVDFEAATKAVDEITISVRDHFGGQAVVPGLRVTKSFPFTGDKDLWNFGTGQWGSSMPRGSVEHGRLVVGMEVRAADGETAANHVLSTVDEVKRYLELQRTPLETFNATINARLHPLVKARRDRRGAAQNLLDRF